MKFSGVTQDVQQRYDLDKSFWTSSCEYEEWDSAEKLCYLLFSVTPLIGEVCLSQEQYEEFSKKGRELFAKLLQNTEQALPLLERQILSAAVVFHVQQADDEKSEDDENSDHLWDYVLKKLEFSEGFCGVNRSKAYHMLRDLVQGTLRISTDHGKKYYNTIKMQALAPASSISELFNIIYQFYKKNLECQYDEAENAFQILSQNIQKKIIRADGSDQINLGSSVWALKSSLKVLFQYHPEYMAAVCDAIAKKIDLYLRGDNPGFCDCNRWDVLLQKWFQSKTKEEWDNMQRVRARRVRQKIITTKEAIRPQYLMQDEELTIRLPHIRLPEITQPPVARLYQNGRVVAQLRMSVYGDPMCYTTQEFTFELDQLQGISFNDRFDFQVEIICGGSVLYDSKTLLFRQYLVFNENGYESLPFRCQNGKARIVAPANAVVRIIDADDNYFDESADFQIFQVSLLSAQEIWVNDVDILAQEDSKELSVHGYCIPESVKGAVIISGEKRFQIYDRVPTLHVVLGENTSAKNFRIFIDSTPHSLYEYIGEKHTGEIDLPAAARFCHRIQIVEVHTGEVMFETTYIILRQFSVCFANPYYFNQACTGDVTVKYSGGTYTYSFALLEDQDMVQFPLLGNGLDISVDVPKINITANGENVLYWPEKKWHEDISQDTFIKVSRPADLQIDLVLGDKFIPKTRRGNAYEIGNLICAIERETASIPFGALIRHEGVVDELKIAEIYFLPTFLSSPLVREDTQIIWQPEDRFIGPDRPVFAVELDNDLTDDPWTYKQLSAGKAFERNFSCRPGRYECRVFLEPDDDNPFAIGNRRQLVWEENFEIAEAPEKRFEGECVRLLKTWFWSYETRKVEVAKIHYNDAVIFDIDYIGTSDFDGEFDSPVPAYEGILCFRSPDQKWNYMNNDPENEQYENVNPVSFCIVHGNRVKVFNADGDLLQLDAMVYTETGYVRIKNRKWDCTVEEERSRFPIADEFAFREEDDA